MLENQLPLLVLQKLAALQKDESLKDVNDLTKHVLKFFNHYIPIKYLPVFNHCHHILEIFRKGFLIEEPRKHKVRGGGGGGRHISATELVGAGITIKRIKSRSLMDISFNDVDLVLKLPPIVVDDSMEPVYLNQMAFKRFHVGAGNEVTSFVYFMDSLFESSSDVSMLHKCGVIQNAIRSEDDVAMLFHTLAKEVMHCSIRRADSTRFTGRSVHTAVRHGHSGELKSLVPTSPIPGLLQPPPSYSSSSPFFRLFSLS